MGCTKFCFTENAILCGVYVYAGYMRENMVDLEVKGQCNGKTTQGQISTL